MNYSHIKRFFDFLVSLILIIFSVPPFLLIFLLVFLDLKEFPLYFQLRHTRYCQTFTLVKIKTMVTLDSFDSHSSHIVATTPFTRLLRRLRLDEIPQLLHILIGHMSFVGPRPYPVSYTDKSTDPTFIYRYAVTSGIFGLAQAHGGEYLDFKSRLRYDIHYINHQSFLFDLKIIFRCLANTFLYSSNQSSSLPFFDV